MSLVHITSYAEGQVFEKMEELRKLRTGRITRSQWVNEAIAEKVEREYAESFSKPAQRATKKKAS